MALPLATISYGGLDGVKNGLGIKAAEEIITFPFDTHFGQVAGQLKHSLCVCLGRAQK